MKVSERRKKERTKLGKKQEERKTLRKIRTKYGCERRDRVMWVWWKKDITVREE